MVWLMHDAHQGSRIVKMQNVVFDIDELILREQRDQLLRRKIPRASGKAAQMGHQDGGAASVASRAVGVLFGPPDLCRDLGREQRNRREFRGPRQRRDLNMTRAAIAATGPPTPKNADKSGRKLCLFASRAHSVTFKSARRTAVPDLSPEWICVGCGCSARLASAVPY